MSNKKCDYCGGITTDDMRGNCGACGAPRKVDLKIVRPMEIFTDVSMETSACTITRIPTEWMNECLISQTVQS